MKVGNRVNILTRWQSLEYITSQNLDRRAYAYLNAMTVVPGAVGAWRKSAVVAAGGYLRDTMAEDMELTYRLRRDGWRITADPETVGCTEAPATLRMFFRQRFRWTYGTLQCLWKHRGALFRYGWFGWVAIPAVWLFQVFFQALGPLVDLKLALDRRGLPGTPGPRWARSSRIGSRCRGSCGSCSWWASCTRSSSPWT